jgi:hypothetical protein
MLTQRFITFIALLMCTNNLLGQATFTAIKSGEWNDPDTWSLTLGDDEDGIPDANDNASSEDFTIQINSNEAVKNFSLISNTASSALQLLGGDLEVSGDLTLVTASDKKQVSTLDLYSGNITIHGDIKYSNPNSVNDGGIIIFNDNEYEGLAKTITLGGNINTNLSNKMNIIIEGEKKDAFNLIITGGKKQQIIATSKDVEYSKIKIENQSTLNFYGKKDAPSISDSIVILNGTILLDMASMTKIKEFESQIVVYSGSRIIAVDDIPFPDHTIKNNKGFVTNMMEGSFSEFRITEGEKADILEEAFNYRNVILSGKGKKVLKNNIGGGSSDPLVNTLTLEEGLLEINSSVTDISSIGSLLIIKSGATLEIQSDVKMPDNSKIVLEDGATLTYSGNNDQTILGDMTYNKLILSGKGKKTINAPITITQELSFDSDVESVNLESDITLKSDANGTAYIGEIPNGMMLNYGQGQFVCEQYFISSPIDNINATENYRDLSLPVIASEAILSQFDDDNPYPYAYSGGEFTNLEEFPIFGVPDCRYPNVAKSNVNTFNSSSGLFETPNSYNESIVQLLDNKISTNAVRFGWADNSGSTITIRGKINVGDIAFNAQKSATGKDYNFFGNPYPCPIDFEKIVAGNENFNTSGNGIKPIFYVVAPDMFGANNTGFYNAITNVGTISKDIPTYQGFFLQVEGANSTDYDFTIKEDMKAEVNSHTYKRNVESKPDLFTIKAFENDILKDQIHYYFFEDATNGYEEAFDVKKLDAKASNLSGVQLDFFDGKKNLNLLANAISNNLDLELQFTISNPDENDVQVELSNVSAVLDAYNCVYVENVNSGEIFKSDGDFISISVGNSSNEIYVIKALKSDELLNLQTSDATCYGFTDGNISFDTHKLPVNSHISISRDNIEFESFLSTGSSYSKTVNAGEYEVVVSGISEMCSYIFRSKINESEKVSADFTISDSLYTNTEIVFTSASENHSINEWLSTNNEILYGENASLTFDTPGRYWIKLTAIGDYENCKDENIKFFDVEQLETSVGTKNEFFKKVFVSTINGVIEIHNIPKNTVVNLLTNEGRFLETSLENNEKVTFKEQNAGVYLIRFTNGVNSTTQQFGVSH